jgi:hypothetical protein
MWIVTNITKSKLGSNWKLLQTVITDSLTTNQNTNKLKMTGLTNKNG